MLTKPSVILSVGVSIQVGHMLCSLARARKLSYSMPGMPCMCRNVMSQMRCDEMCVCSTWTFVFLYYILSNYAESDHRAMNASASSSAIRLFGTSRFLRISTTNLLHRSTVGQCESMIFDIRLLSAPFLDGVGLFFR